MKIPLHMIYIQLKMEFYEKNVLIGNQKVRVVVKNNQKTIEISYFPPLSYLDETSQDGEHLTSNDLHQNLICCLIKDDNELSKISGLTTPSDYRVQLTRAISSLWN